MDQAVVASEMMSASENKKLVAQIFEELARGKHRALLSRTAEDSRWTIVGSSAISGTFHSRQEFYEKALKAVTSRLTARVKPTVIRILGEGDLVIVEWRGESTARSGMDYNNSYCWILEIHDGKITEGTIYNDTELVARLMKD